MRFSTSFIAASLVTVVTAGLARPSFAQYPPPQPYPAPQPNPYNQYPGPQPNQMPPPSQVSPNGEYVAPLSQQTQQVYVPQSVALSGPRMIKDWDENQPIPPGYHRETRIRKGLVIAGALVFGIPYLYSAGFAAIGDDVTRNGESNPAKYLYVPVLGPFIEMGQTDSSSLRYFLALDGIAQSAGAFMFIYALAAPKNVLVRNDLAMLTVMPTKMGHDGQGLTVLGRF
jgi:hypothetical protein